jgi:hypothetical protein
MAHASADTWRTIGVALAAGSPRAAPTAAMAVSAARRGDAAFGGVRGAPFAFAHDTACAGVSDAAFADRGETALDGARWRANSGAAMTVPDPAAVGSALATRATARPVERQGGAAFGSVGEAAFAGASDVAFAGRGEKALDGARTAVRR